MSGKEDKGKYFLCQTHAKLFLIAHDGLDVEDVVVKSMKSKPKKVEINFERFTMKGEANSYITSFIFGIPIGLNSNTILGEKVHCTHIVYKDIHKMVKKQKKME